MRKLPKIKLAIQFIYWPLAAADVFINSSLNSYILRDSLCGRKAVFLSCCTYRCLCPLTLPQDSTFSFVTFNSSKELSVAAVQLRGQLVTDLNNYSRGGYTHRDDFSRGGYTHRDDFSRGGYTHRDACSMAHVKTHAHMHTHVFTQEHDFS